MTSVERLTKLEAKVALALAGFAGVSSTGEIVDRREHPDSRPIKGQENIYTTTKMTELMAKEEGHEIGAGFLPFDASQTKGPTK